jgi:5-methylcytosine-specific restriction enzyme A
MNAIEIQELTNAPAIRNLPVPRPRSLEEMRSSQRDKVTRGVAGNARQAIYRTAQWQTLRKVVLSEQPVCAVCHMRLSQEVDHIVPLQQDATRAFDRTNLQGLCVKCHTRKTNQERRS